MKSPRVTNYVGKNSRSQKLPSRFAVEQLTQGNPAQRSINNYARLTPGPKDFAPSVVELESNGGKLRR